MQRIVMVALAVLAAFYLFFLTFSEGNENTVKQEGTGEIQMSKQLKRILSAEMNGIQSGMTGLAIAIPAGHWEDIIEISTNMKETYIMKKKLSTGQISNFKRSLPQGYLDIDRKFHEAAAQLGDAAREHNASSLILYFAKMNESCVECHSKYAVKRFQGFGPR